MLGKWYVLYFQLQHGSVVGPYQQVVFRTAREGIYNIVK